MPRGAPRVRREGRRRMKTSPGKTSIIHRTSSQAKQVSMIAGGTGITPMLQLVSPAANIKKGKVY